MRSSFDAIVRCERARDRAWWWRSALRSKLALSNRSLCALGAFGGRLAPVLVAPTRAGTCYGSPPSGH